MLNESNGEVNILGGTGADQIRKKAIVTQVVTQVSYDSRVIPNKAKTHNVHAIATCIFFFETEKRLWHANKYTNTKVMVKHTQSHSYIFFTHLWCL